MDFLRLIGAINKGKDTEMHPTVAGLLMFGYDFSIISEFPNYHLDYLEYSDDFNQWTYRLTSGTGEFTGNIFNFITEVSARLNIQNQKRKVVEDMARVDDPPLLRAQRELLSNALMHSDYRGLRGIRAEWSPGRFRVRNPGDLRIPLDEMFAGGVSDPRNPHIAVMLSLIGMAERAGSGVCSVVDCCKSMSLPLPEYEETSDPETVTVTLRMDTIQPDENIDEIILRLMKDEPSISIDRLSESLGIERSRLTRMINSLKDKGRVERVGGTRGKWKIKV